MQPFFSNLRSHVNLLFQDNSIGVDIIDRLYCNESWQRIPPYVEPKDLHSTFIANSIFNNFLTYPTITLNIMTMYAIKKISTMEATLKTLLLSLVVSDVGVGLVNQPFFLVKWLQMNDL